MNRYSSHEVIKKTGVKQWKLKYLEDTGKIIPIERTAGMRYYSEKQLMEIMQIMKKPVEVGYVCVDCRKKTNIDMKAAIKELREKIEKMKEKLQSSSIIIEADLLPDNIEKTHLEGLIEKAQNGLVNKLYIASDLGFPQDLIAEYTKWLKYMGVEMIDLAAKE